MPQPAEVGDQAEAIILLFRRAQDTIEAEIAGLADVAGAGRRRRYLRELSGSISEHLTRLEADSRALIETGFPSVYGLGAADGAVSIGGQFTWSSGHVNVVTALAQDAYDDILAATRFVDDAAKAWVREMARDAARATILEGSTARQAARAMAKATAGEMAAGLGGPVGMVRYTNGALHRLADYTDMLVRTKTAQAYNAGTLTHLKGAGVEWIEVLDGPDCGWTRHDDPDRANGSVRSWDDAVQWPLSHPRCARSFAGRPDITTPEEAAAAGADIDQVPTPAPTPEPPSAAGRAARQPRTPRAAQSPGGRTPRTPRASRGSQLAGVATGAVLAEVARRARQTD